MCIRDRDTRLTAFVCLAISVAGFILDFARNRNKALNRVVVMIMAPIMRRSEREGFTGLPFYALGVSLTLFIFPKDIALLSIMFLVYSVTVSSFFGVLYGKDKILPNNCL